MKYFLYITVFVLTVAHLAYFEVLPISLPYVTTTPYGVFILPYVFVFGVMLYEFKKPILPLSFILLLSLYPIFIAGRGAPFENTIFKSSEQKTPFRICSWNSAYFFEWGREEAYQQLVTKECDLIALQEVWKAKEYQYELDYARKTYFPEHDVRFSDEFVFFIPKTSDNKTYTSASEAYFGIDISAKGEPVTIIATHIWNPIVPKPYLEKGRLLYKDATHARNEQTQDLLQFIDTRASQIPLIVIGDLNTLPNQSIIRSIQSSNAHLRVVPRPVFMNPLTYSSTRRLIQIDYAFVSQEIRPNAKLTLSCRAGSSDHCLLILDVLL